MRGLSGFVDAAVLQTSARDLSGRLARLVVSWLLWLLRDLSGCFIRCSLVSPFSLFSSCPLSGCCLAASRHLGSFLEHSGSRAIYLPVVLL